MLRGALACAVLLVAGCTSLRSDFSAPGVATPAAWSNTAHDRAAVSNAALAHVALEDAWWTHFDDAELNRLIDLALQNNSDLVAAAWNIQQARYSAGLAADSLTPSLGANASSSARRDLDGGSTSHSYAANLSLSYELDLWGKIAAQKDSADWRLAATEQDLQTTAMSLIASVATLYWQLAYQNEQIASGEQSLDYVRRTQQLIQAQYAAGMVSGLEVQESRRSVASQEAALVTLRQNRVATRNALAVLLNVPPSDEALAALLPAEPPALPTTAVPELPVGVPAEVLARRPDLQAAEARLRATLADADTTRASYYPGISLTAGASSSSTSLGNLLSNPVGSLAASLSLPFLQQTQMRLNTASARASYEAAAIAFQKSLLTALQEVEDALGTRRQLAQQQRWLEEQLDAARQAEQRYEVRYRTGSTALKSWLDAQESRRNAELALSANRLARLTNQVTLYKALGGDTVVPAPELATTLAR
ncbi:efflux transporter outer membrane subunit [Corticibacter populi]|uniref:Efflux transporter outer membrane subunit n=2 Tax=Corticibacter populi TaxID=1550736 RepID=A0A3M6QSQ4_9BURK|nr:efflux transporter outer membrane subunit [Corticibacter populi]